MTAVSSSTLSEGDEAWWPSGDEQVAPCRGESTLARLGLNRCRGRGILVRLGYTENSTNSELQSGRDERYVRCACFALK